MTTRKLGRTAVLTAGVLALAALSACGSDSDDGGSTGSSESSGGGGAKIAFLMPDLASTRYEQYDAPLFKAKMAELCPDCEVIYQNADSDASKQQQQASSALVEGVNVLVIDPVDSAAAATIVNEAQSQGVKVMAYDRPIPDIELDYYVSFDNEAIGAAIAQSLVDDLKASGATGGILQVNGSPTDAAAGLIKKGIHSAVDSSGFELLAEYDTPEWAPSKAQEWVSGQITQYGPRIIGVVAANDGTGGGAISAFKSAGVNPVPPVTGNDAEVAALQRIIQGDQFNTISKPIKTVADGAAEVAYKLSQGETVEGKTTLFDTPSELFEPTVVTQENIKAEIFDSGLFTAAEVCTAEYKAACDSLGIA